MNSVPATRRAPRCRSCLAGAGRCQGRSRGARQPGGPGRHGGLRRRRVRLSGRQVRACSNCSTPSAPCSRPASRQLAARTRLSSCGH
ncbi:MAG: hypothetical protein MZW92_00905 [Comamonadaceae bacterium]|nr:hypothetical protein [Comamonadaceae bacterium]